MKVVFPEDGSETTVSRIKEGDARSVCLSRCNNDAANAFYAVRLNSQGQFKCKCLGHSLSPLIAGYEGYRSPVQDVPCPEYTDPLKTALHADTDLRAFLNESTLSLWTKLSGQDNSTDQRVNICNQDRDTDIVTLYLASAFRLSVSNIVNNFVFDEVKNYIPTFPNHTTNGPDAIYPPDQLAAFPNLEQSYWTIMSQLTTSTEPLLRTAERSPKWCWHVGYAVRGHCVETRDATSCPAGAPNANTMCNKVWKHFVEGCHRVLSLDTSVYPYRQGTGQYYSICVPTDQNAKFYELSRL